MTTIFSIIIAGALAFMAVAVGSGTNREIEYAGEATTVKVPATAGDHVLRVILAILAVTSLTLPALHGGWLLVLIVLIAVVVLAIFGRGAEAEQTRLDDAENAWRAEMWEAERAEAERASEAMLAEARANAEAMRQEQRSDPAYRRAEAEARLRGLIAGGGAGEEDSL